MKLTAPDLVDLGVIDAIVEEPSGGAHADPPEAIRRVGEAIEEALTELEGEPLAELLEHRYNRFRVQGVFEES